MKRLVTGLTLSLVFLFLLFSCKEIVGILGLNNAPIADPGPAQEVDFGELVTLDGRASSDPDGDALIYSWTVASAEFGSDLGNNDITDSDSQRAFVTPDIPGDFIFTLTVTDEYEESDSADVTITVREQVSPATPTGLHISATTDSSLTIAWNASDGAENYTLYRDVDENGSFITSIYFGSSTSKLDDGQGVGLPTGAELWYKVKASNAAGESLVSDAVSGTVGAEATLPDAPTNLTATSVSDSSVTLDWDVVAIATDYQILRSADDTNFTQIDEVSTNTYIDTTVSGSTIYYYAVSASNSAGASAASTSIMVTTDLSVPTGLTVGSPTQTSLVVSWTDVGAPAYTLARSDDGGTSYTEISTTAVSPYTDDTPALASGTVYYYKVKSTDGVSTESAYSIANSGLTKPATPSAPTVGNASESTLTVSWTAETGAEEYFVYSDKTTPASFVDLEYNGADLQFIDSGLAASTAYNYQVVAWNSSGYSGDSSTGSGTTAATAGAAPGAPGTPTVVSATSTSITIGWTAATEAATYSVYSDSSGSAAVVGTTGALQFTETGLSPATNYTYYVNATNSQGTGPDSGSVVGTTLSAAPDTPGAPTVSGATNTTLDISWATVTGAATYTLHRSTDGVNFTDLSLGLAVTTYNDTGLNEGTTYYYRVQAFNVDSIGSDLSIYGFGTTTSSVTEPANVQVTTPTVSSLTVTWDDTGTADAYRVFRDTSLLGSFANMVQEVTGTTLTDSGLSPVTTYHYKVKAVEGTAASDFSIVASGTTLAPAPTTPTGLTVGGATATSLIISWDEVPYATSYTVHYGGDDPLVDPPVYTGPYTSFTDDGLTPSNIYSYMVMASNLTDDSEYSLPEIGSTLGQPPEAPATVTAEVLSNSSIRVSWTAVADADFYKIYREREDGPFGLLTVTENATTLIIINDNLPSGTVYTYYVKAVNDLGDSPYSVPATDKTGGPRQPDYIDAYDAGAYSVQVSWDWVDGVDGYTLYRSTDPDAVWDVLPSTSETGIRDGGLVPNTEYFYKVTAFAGGEESTFSPIVSISTTDLPTSPPDDPWVWWDGITSNSVQLGWDFIQEAAYYEVYVSPTGDTGSYVLEDLTPDTKYLLTNLLADTEYWIDVVAVNDFGTSDPEFNVVSIWTSSPPAAAPAAPDITGSDEGANWVDINWDWPMDAEYFILERSDDGGATWVEIFVGPSTWFYDQGMAPGFYQYRVQAANSLGFSPYSNPPLLVEITGSGGVIIIVQ